MRSAFAARDAVAVRPLRFRADGIALAAKALKLAVYRCAAYPLAPRLEECKDRVRGKMIAVRVLQCVLDEEISARYVLPAPLTLCHALRSLLKLKFGFIFTFEIIAQREANVKRKRKETERNRKKQKEKMFILHSQRRVIIKKLSNKTK